MSNQRDLLYNGNALGLLAYALGLAASLLAAANGRQRTLRLEQRELLLAQTQRSHEQQLRAARLEESTRIAREIHDVLAHTLAGLTIQLEATGALVEQGADRNAVLGRLHRAHEPTREGRGERRRAAGAAAPNLPDQLTPREAEVLSLIAHGLSNGEIAAALVVSEATVKTHINHVFAKIGARDRAQAVHYVYTHGLAD